MIRLILLLALLAPPAAAETVMTNRIVRAQTILQPGDLVLGEGDIVGSAINFDEVVGQEARIILYPGRPVMIDQIGPPAIIERNQIVTLRFATGGLVILADGRSLTRAGVGDVVRAMNLASRKTVSGVVRADGTILVR